MWRNFRKTKNRVLKDHSVRSGNPKSWSSIRERCRCRKLFNREYDWDADKTYVMAFTVPKCTTTTFQTVIK